MENILKQNSFQTLLEACLRNEASAQRKFYEQFKGKMYGVCLRYANRREDAEDILQEGFVKVFQDLHQYRGAGSLEGWIRKVIVNVALQYLNKQKKNLAQSSLNGIEYQLSDEPTVFEEDHPAKMLIKLMQKMPPGFRTVLNLYILEGYTHPEIAHKLGISVGTSKSQYMRAKAHLRKLLEENLST